MIYIPIDMNIPIQTKTPINIQNNTTNNFPEIIFELHNGKYYFDLGDSCTLYATITNTDLGTVSFSGTLSIMNPHRGQIQCILNSKDFSETGVNTLTVIVDTGNIQYSFQQTIFVQSMQSNIIKYFKG